MAVTDPDAPPYQRLSMFIVPIETPGIEFVRHTAVGYESKGAHAYLRYNDVRIPRDHMLGEPGQGFKVAMSALAHGRLGVAAGAVGIGIAALAGRLEADEVVVQDTGGQVQGWRGEGVIVIDASVDATAPSPAL